MVKGGRLDNYIDRKSFNQEPGNPFRRFILGKSISQSAVSGIMPINRLFRRKHFNYSLSAIDKIPPQTSLTINNSFRADSIRLPKSSLTHLSGTVRNGMRDLAIKALT